jgi:DNA-binding response OmpR family regulator
MNREAATTYSERIIAARAQDHSHPDGRRPPLLIPTILVVDHDAATREAFCGALEGVGFQPLAAATGESGYTLACEHQIHLMLVECNLPDISGVDLARRALADGTTRWFILTGGFLTIETSVTAMRLGAFDVLEKPVPIARLIAAVQDCLHGARKNHRPLDDNIAAIQPLFATGRQPGSALDRWAMHVVKASESESDLRTLEDWAKCAAVSYSTLCESCRMVGIRPQAARDFARALRAVIKSSVYHCDPAVLLDVRDQRTLKTLLSRAGPFFRATGSTSIVQFIQHQRFVPVSNEGIRVLLTFFDKNREHALEQSGGRSS